MDSDVWEYFIKITGYLAIVVVIIAIISGIYEFWKGNKYVALLYLCYSVANLLLVVISSKVSK